MNQLLWAKTYAGNDVLTGDTFYLSYNSMEGTLAATLPGAGSDDGGPETALTNRETDEFFVLNGDYRAECEALFSQGFEALKAFFLKEMGSHGSSWSTNETSQDKG